LHLTKTQTTQFFFWGSFSTLSFVAKDKKNTTINYNRRQSEYNKAEAPPLFAMVGSKVPLPNCTQKHKIKKEKSMLPHTIVPIGTKKIKKKISTKMKFYFC
jgi:hypothetical protein